MPNYYLELPEGYKIKKVVDAKKDKKLIVLLTNIYILEKISL